MSPDCDDSTGKRQRHRPSNPDRRLPHPGQGQQQANDGDAIMIRYETSISRAACAVAAVCMTALVFGIAVVLPATVDTGIDEYATAGCTPIPPAGAA
jgi:hypothetical protein